MRQTEAPAECSIARRRCGSHRLIADVTGEPGRAEVFESAPKFDIRSPPYQ